MRHLHDVGELRQLGGRLLGVHVCGDVQTGYHARELVQLVDGEAELRAQRLDVENLVGAHRVGLGELDGRFLELTVLLLGAVHGLAHAREGRVDLDGRSARGHGHARDGCRYGDQLLPGGLDSGPGVVYLAARLGELGAAAHQLAPGGVQVAARGHGLLGKAVEAALRLLQRGAVVGACDGDGD